MNCKNVEELLPLYVGRDLEAERAGQITSHLQSCIECARSARDYVEAKQLLQVFGPPQFSEATYAAVRGNVLREIERKSSGPGLFEFLMRPWPLQVRWAVSVAIMIVVCAFAYYFLADRLSGWPYTQQAVQKQNTGVKKPVDQQAAAPNETAVVPPAPAPRSVEPGFKRKQLSLIAHASRHSTRAGEAPAGPVKAASYSLVEPKDATLTTSATSDKTLRLEIQTTNPNIRIIWFSHPPNTEASPNESSKGI